MKKRIKLTAIILATVLALGAVAGGIYLYKKNANKLTNEEAKQILDDLIPKAEKINGIIWGKGLPVENGTLPALDSVTTAQYRTVDSACGYGKVEDLRKAVSEVYSERYIETGINYTAFDGATDENGTEYSISPRYTDNNDGRLCIDITNSGFNLDTKISTDKTEVKSCDFDKVTVEVKATVSGMEVPLDITLVKQENGWRLDTPTY